MTRETHDPSALIAALTNIDVFVPRVYAIKNIHNDVRLADKDELGASELQQFRVD